MFKDKPLAIRKSLVKAMIQRMAQAYGVDIKALPQQLGCQKNVVSNWRYYGRIPYEHLYHCSEVTGVSLDWLLHGKSMPLRLSQGQCRQLQGLLQQLFDDGLAFDMISESYCGALNQLMTKFSKDLEIWSAALENEKADIG